MLLTLPVRGFNVCVLYYLLFAVSGDEFSGCDIKCFVNVTETIKVGTNVAQDSRGTKGSSKDTLHSGTMSAELHSFTKSTKTESKWRE